MKTIALAFVLLVSAPSFAQEETLKVYQQCTKLFPPCLMLHVPGKKEVIRVLPKPAMTLGSNDVKSAQKAVDAQNNTQLLMLHLSDEAGKKFAEVTKANVKKRLAIVVGNEVLAAPVVETEITGGNVQLSAGTGNDFKYLTKVEWLKKLTETPAK